MCDFYRLNSTIWTPEISFTYRYFVTHNRVIRSTFSILPSELTRTGFFITGMANGVLPYGFVYLALPGLAATQSVTGGASYMILFGLGTFPVMMAVSAFGKVAGVKFRSFLNKAALVLMVILGLLFILRGINMQAGIVVVRESS